MMINNRSARHCVPNRRRRRLLQASVEAISQKLRTSCPTIFREEDRIRHKVLPPPQVAHRTWLTLQLCLSR